VSLPLIQGIGQNHRLRQARAPHLNGKEVIGCLTTDDGFGQEEAGCGGDPLCATVASQRRIAPREAIHRKRSERRSRPSPVSMSCGCAKFWPPPPRSAQICSSRPWGAAPKLPMYRYPQHQRRLSWPGRPRRSLKSPWVRRSTATSALKRSEMRRRPPRGGRRHPPMRLNRR
jgi:hypothetical protein